MFINVLKYVFFILFAISLLLLGLEGYGGGDSGHSVKPASSQVTVTIKSNHFNLPADRAEAK